ncbi:hypothetical protein EJB05_14258, partial [Eragrostis curvula]
MAPPPELNYDAIAEIFLRLPPDEPACLFRAALVCKPWRHIISDPSFSRRYRKFHRTPPLLGFIHNTIYRHGHGPVPRFVPTTAAASPFSQINSAINDNPWWIADCRHGRVLVRRNTDDAYIVWDPITGRQEELHRPDIPHETYTVVVLCAVAGCDHRDCHGGPFHVLFLCTADHRLTMHAFVYSSTARAWGTPVSASTGSSSGYGFHYHRGALIGDVYYCNLGYGDRIAKYQLGGDALEEHYKVVAMAKPVKADFSVLCILVPEVGDAFKCSICKPWRHIVSDPAFSRRYREFHRTPPLLGFLHNTTYRPGHGPVARFVPTTAAASLFSRFNSAIDGKPWWIADCRHGRVLVRQWDVYIVWDPITGSREELHRPDIHPETDTVVVLCAAAITAIATVILPLPVRKQ